MRSWKSRPTPALVVLVLLASMVFFTFDIGDVSVLAVGSLLVLNYLAHRYANTHLGSKYPRHGDRMD